jgi:galactose mutarotase-like enzyme
MSGPAAPDTSGPIAIARDGLQAVIRPHGAEMVALRLAGEDLLWPGDDAVWTGRSPLLFPIVGRLAGDALRLGERSYTLPQHGFARRSDFAVVDAGEASCRLRLEDGEETRSVYPFRFALDVEYALVDGGVAITARVFNPGPGDLPASFGFHPALRWPLEPGRAETDYELIFSGDRELETARPTADGLIARERSRLALPGGRLALDEALFAPGALVFPQWASRELVYAPRGGGRGLRIAFDGLPHGALWMRPGADFLCVEPWCGHADPEDFRGDFTQKPGLLSIPPGESRSFRLSITPVEV